MLVAAGVGSTALAASDGGSGQAHPEDRLSAAITAMQAGAYADASRRLEALVRDEPNFRLANLLDRKSVV